MYQYSIAANSMDGTENNNDYKCVIDHDTIKPTVCNVIGHITTVDIVIVLLVLIFIVPKFKFGLSNYNSDDDIYNQGRD